MSNIQSAMQQVIEALKSDEGYFISWQANIAMAFKDELAKRGKTVDSEMHEIANQAAKNFLNLLTYIPENIPVKVNWPDLDAE